MANAIHPKLRQLGLGAGVDWLGNDIKLLYLPTGYTQGDFEADEFLSDLQATVTEIATSANLTGKGDTDGFATADEVATTISSGQNIRAIVLIIDTGVAATSRLVYYADTTATGVPINITTDGQPARIPWPTQGIFRL